MVQDGGGGRRFHRTHTSDIRNMHGKKTFDNQDALPALPLPKLDRTLDKYIESARAVLSEEEWAETRRVVDEFRHSPLATQLQDGLQKKADNQRNWLESWWYSAYCTTRSSLIFQNMGAYNPRAVKKHNRQLETAAEYTHLMMQHWLQLRQETIVPVERRNGEAWCMFQQHCLFNATRLPHPTEDTLMRTFKTVSSSESCPSHVVVLCRGQVWRMETCETHETGLQKILSMSSLVHSLRYINEHSDLSESAVSTLTLDKRDRWAEAREAIRAFSLNNNRLLHDVDTAAFVLSLTQWQATDESELMRSALLGPEDAVWADKNCTVVVHADSRVTHMIEHCNLDAIANFEVADVVGRELRTDAWTAEETEWKTPEHLVFDLPPSFPSWLARARLTRHIAHQSIHTKVTHFQHWGNGAVKEKRLYADTLIQLSIQLAYYLQHGQTAALYETASTRKFYHGRTDTVRGCTREAGAFCKAVTEAADEEKQRQLFQKAYERHNTLMAEAMLGEGIDRHMYGLRMQAQQDMLPSPALFTDAGWKKSGGDGNYTLSTSFLGYSNDGMFGWVTAMCQKGYGCYYRIGDESLSFTLTRFSIGSADLDAFERNLFHALRRIGHIARITHNTQ